MGTLILYQELPEQMRDILAEAREQDLDIAAVQRERLGFDYAQLSAELFKAWHLPDALVAPIRDHTRPAQARDSRLEAGILHVAVQLAAARAERRSLNELVPGLDDTAWDAVGLSMESLEEVDHAAQALTEEIVPVLLNSAA